jgi:putative peptide zinc metalloprotease protein
VSMIPVGGATRQHPAFFVIPGKNGQPAVAVISTSSPNPSNATGGTFTNPQTGAGGATTTSTAPSTSPSSSPSASPSPAAAFPFKLPAAPGPGGTQALAENTTNGGVLYDIAYSLVTVSGGAPVTNTNSAYALANCKGCTTVAVSFQVVLIVGQSRIIAPINAAGALNYNCPACTTTAIADQIVVTLKALPSQPLLQKLEADLKQLNALPALGVNGTPTALAAAVSTVQQQIQTELDNSGLPTNPPAASKTTTTPSSSGPSQSGSSSGSTSTTPQGSSATGATGSSPGQATTTATSPTTTPAPTSQGSGTTSTATTTTPSG